MPGKQIGTIYMCVSCCSLLRNRVKEPVVDKSLVREGIKCIRCGITVEKEPIVEVPAIITKNYNPNSTITNSLPTGEPWYITGYLG